MTSDRRIRLRPKDGARSLYYAGGFGGPTGSTSFRQNLLAQPANGQTLPWLANNQGGALPWLSNRPAAGQSPNSPNTLQTSSNPSFTDAFNVSNLFNSVLGIGGATGQRSATNPAANLFNNLGTAGGAVSGVAGLPWLQSALTSINSISGGAGNLLEPLAQTDGMVFPYTPTLDYGQQVDYSSYDPTHTNQELHSYTRTKAPTININGKFTSQNSFEASYSLAAFHFCRVVSKMAQGQSQNPGTPPPILLLSGYGDYILNDIPVIMTNFNVSFPDDVDYVKVQNSNSYVPSVFSISLSLIVQNTPTVLRSFNLEQFRSGQLLKNKGWT